MWAATVSGVVTYDKIDHHNNRELSQAKLVGAHIEARSGANVISGVTGAGGSYSLDVGSLQQVSIVVYSKSDYFAVASQLSGRTAPASSIYSFTSENVNTSTDVQHNFNISIANKAGAFNILHQFERGRTWLKAYGYNLSASPRTDALWPSSNGTYYDQDNVLFNILGVSSSNSDPDEFDDDIILHEFGHLAMDKFSLDHSLGGSHSLAGHYDLRLSWSEGAATYLSSAIRDNSKNLDFNGTSNTSSVDISNPDNNQVRSSNEIAVAAFLWKAHTLDGSPAKVLQAINSFKNLPNTLVGEQISLDTFIDQYSGSDLSTTINDLQMSYKVDGLSGGSAFTNAVDLNSYQSKLTFYPSKASDWFKVTGNAGDVYTFKTQNTQNGALVSLNFYDSSLATPLSSATPAQAKTVSGSSIIESTTLQATLPRSGTFYLEVARFTSASKNYGLLASDGALANTYNKTVGRYGNYDLDVQVVRSSTGGGSTPTTNPQVETINSGNTQTLSTLQSVIASNNLKEISNSLNQFSSLVGGSSGNQSVSATLDGSVTVHAELISSASQVVVHPDPNLNITAQDLPTSHSLVVATTPLSATGFNNLPTGSLGKIINLKLFDSSNNSVSSGFSSRITLKGLASAVKPKLYWLNAQGNFEDSNFSITESGNDVIVTATHFSTFVLVDTNSSSSSSGISFGSSGGGGGGGGGCLLKP